VLRCPPPLLAAALRALLVVAGSAAATVATAWSWPSQRARAALLILHAPQIAAAQAGRGGVKLLERGGSAARRVAVPAHRGAPDRVCGFGCSRSRPAARRRDVLAWAGGEARSQAADGADGRRHGPRGHDCGGSSTALRVGGAAGGSGGGSCGGGDGRIRPAGDGARLAVAACCASAEFHDRAAGCATSPILRGWP